MSSKTLVFIHGMFMNSLCWEHWVERFQGYGYKCIAPDWPGRDETVKELRARHPNPELGMLTLTEVIDYFAGLIGKLDEKPVLIGHSMGGLVTQILLGRYLAAAAVAIDSAPPQGVFSTSWPFLKANWPMINPFISKRRPHLMSFRQFQYAFVNTMAPNEQRAAYDRYVIPESRQVPRESLTRTARIDFKRDHAPLLLVAGSADHIIPASLNRTNHKKYAGSASITDFMEFPERVHFTIGQDGWEEVADYVDNWLKNQ
ncbi:MAG: alpha/beta hydrolase [Thermoleophilia bacterium]|nr:alpha/beta hydrolase [Thermoleophilia bacterium]